MRRIASFARAFLDEEQGATMVEYGIMIALIAAVCIGIVTTLGTQIQTVFTNTSNAIAAA